MLSKDQSISYIDVLTVLISLFAALWIVSNNEEISARGNLIDKSEFIVEMTWTEKSYNDIDLWVQNPRGEIVNFTEKDVGLMTLDRDDIGTNNKITNEDNQIIENTNRKELVSIRGIIPGKFVVNSMFYKNNMGREEKIKVSVIKLNPYQEVIQREFILKSVGDQYTAASFIVNNDGTIKSVNTTEQVKLGIVK